MRHTSETTRPRFRYSVLRIAFCPFQAAAEGAMTTAVRFACRVPGATLGDLRACPQSMQSMRGVTVDRERVAPDGAWVYKGARFPRVTPWTEVCLPYGAWGWGRQSLVTKARHYGLPGYQLAGAWDGVGWRGRGPSRENTPAPDSFGLGHRTGFEHRATPGLGLTPGATAMTKRASSSS